MSLRAFNAVVLQKCLHMPYVQCPARLYSRWTHRNPAKVLLPFEANTTTTLKREKVIDLVLKKTDSKSSEEYEDSKPPNSTSTSVQFKEAKEKKEIKLKKIRDNLVQKKVFDENNEIIYEKCKDNDGRLR